MEKRRKKFYILVPVYNVEKYIHNCIQSVLKQTYQEFSLILVDDGSIDRSGNICDEYAQKDKRIHVIHQENLGQIAARQAAARYAMQQIDFDHDIVVYLDSDDTIKPYTLERINYIFLREECDMVVYGWEKVQDGKVVCPFNTHEEYFGTITDKRELYKIVFLTSNYNSLCRKAISARLLTDKVYGNISHMRHGEDFLQSLSYFSECKKVVFTKDVLYEYTINPSSVTNSVTYENYEINSTLRNLVWKFLKEQDVWSEQDYEEYFAYRREILQKVTIAQIACFDTSMENKIHLFDKLKTDEQNSMVLASATQKDRWLKLLIDSKYKRLCREVHMRTALKFLYYKVWKDRYFRIKGYLGGFRKL